MNNINQNMLNDLETFQREEHIDTVQQCVDFLIDSTPEHLHGEWQHLKKGYQAWNALMLLKNIPLRYTLDSSGIGTITSIHTIDLDTILKEEVLKQLVYPISLQRSTNKLKVTPSVLEIVSRDAVCYSELPIVSSLLKDTDYRVKTVSSIHGKVSRHPELSFQSVFNDILGIRFKHPTYLNNIPSYLRLVDLTQGKAHDDGYRAQHLYYKMDNYHYLIEIQIWADKDYNFNSWSHCYAYKHISNEQLLEIRKLYDRQLITTIDQFREALSNE